MAKFIIEVDDEYIREQSDPERSKSKMGDTDRDGILHELFNFTAFLGIRQRLSDGVSEFHINSEEILTMDKNAIMLFENALARVCMLSVMAMAKKESEPENKKP
jgi:hypothetical protein